MRTKFGSTLRLPKNLIKDRLPIREKFEDPTWTYSFPVPFPEGLGLDEGSSRDRRRKDQLEG
jgi:hypothetical protein